MTDDYEKIISVKRPSHFIHGLSKTRFGFIFMNLQARCYYKKHNRYVNYGGRGIKCEWATFLDFRDDMYASYLEHAALFGEKNTTIDRIDNNGNYSKENCRWATRLEQASNTSRSRFLIFKGEKKTVSEWAREIGIRMPTLHRRLKLGWSVDIALTKSV